MTKLLLLNLSARVDQIPLMLDYYVAEIISSVFLRFSTAKGA